MGFMDKLLSSMRYDDDYEDERPSRKSRSIKTATMDDDYDDEKPAKPQRTFSAPKKGSNSP